jgi:uncharacterized membrane protein YkoI
MKNPIQALLSGTVLALVMACSGSASAAAPTQEPTPHATAAPTKEPTPKTTLTIEQAERIALERVPGGVVESVERDRRLGREVFEVDVRAPDGREHELAIDVIDGRVLAEVIDVDDDD